MNIIKILLVALLLMFCDIFVYPYQIVVEVKTNTSNAEYILTDENNLEVLTNNRIAIEKDILSTEKIESLKITKKRILNPEIKKMIPYESQRHYKTPSPY